MTPLNQLVAIAPRSRSCALQERNSNGDTEVLQLNVQPGSTQPVAPLTIQQQIHQGGNS